MADNDNANDKVPCCSKSNVAKANERVLLKFKDDVDRDLAERLHGRFQEIYSNAVHQNISLDHKTWSEATEEGNITVDFDPVDQELKNRVDERIQQLDDVLVETTGKRKSCPPEISRQLAKVLKSKRKALVNMHTAESKAASTSRLRVTTQKLTQCKNKLQRTCTELSSLSKSLPLMEHKISRLDEAMRFSESMAGSTTDRILRKPRKGEAKLASSLTPLKRRLEETPIIRRTSPRVAKRVRHGHPIQKYHLRSASKS